MQLMLVLKVIPNNSVQILAEFELVRYYLIKFSTSHTTFYAFLQVASWAE